MPKTTHLRPIAHIHSDFPSKFGVPRQSGLVEALSARIVFEPAFRSPHALRGLEGFSHIWLLWQFSGAHTEGWSPTVRPPRLGGNTRMGVFATRSPFRPNPIGLSSVRLAGIELRTPLGPVLHVLGADLMDGTPILDIKPYLAYTDSHPDASAGFSMQPGEGLLEVAFPPELLCRIPCEKREGLLCALAQDPRPGYQDQPDRRYKMSFAGLDVCFSVEGGRLTVWDVASLGDEK